MTVVLSTWPIASSNQQVSKPKQQNRLLISIFQNDQHHCSRKSPTIDRFWLHFGKTTPNYLVKVWKTSLSGLKESSTDLPLYCYKILRLTMDSCFKKGIKFDTAEPEISSSSFHVFFFLYCLHYPERNSIAESSTTDWGCYTNSG